jgi:hypothetical protein
MTTFITTVILILNSLLPLNEQADPNAQQQQQSTMPEEEMEVLEAGGKKVYGEDLAL